MGSMAQGPGWTFFLLLRCCVILDIYFTLPEPQFSVNGHSRAVLGFNLVTCQGPFPCWHSVDTVVSESVRASSCPFGGVASPPVMGGAQTPGIGALPLLPTNCGLGPVFTSCVCFLLCAAGRIVGPVHVAVTA